MVELYALLYHLKACPDAFLQRPAARPGGGLHTDALLADAYRKVYGGFRASRADLPAVPDLKRLEENHLVSISVACWLFSHSAFAGQPALLPGLDHFLFAVLPPVCRHVKPQDWLEDEDRAEEFVRLALRSCDLLPAGETPAEAADRLDALSTLKRLAVLRQTNESLERARAIRQKMAEEKAREAANVYGRE